MYSIYKITCLINGRIYVGATSRRVEHRIWDHEDLHRSPNRRRNRVSTIQRAIKIYGRENFAFIVLEKVRTAEECVERERHWIRVLGANDRRLGYNRSHGGEGIR